MEKILSIDIETTGLNENKCQILEFGAVVGDFFGPTPVKSLPTFRRRLILDTVSGEPYALAMNAKIIADLANWQKLPIKNDYLYHWQLWKQFSMWLGGQFDLTTPGTVTITGKNVASFDRRFLDKIEKWNWGEFSHRFLDPGSLLFDPRTDRKLPDLKTCAERLEIDLSAYDLHNAVDDAQLVVAVLREYYKEMD